MITGFLRHWVQHVQCGAPSTVAPVCGHSPHNPPWNWLVEPVSSRGSIVWTVCNENTGWGCWWLHEHVPAPDTQNRPDVCELESLLSLYKYNKIVRAHPFSAIIYMYIFFRKNNKLQVKKNNTKRKYYNTKNVCVSLLKRVFQQVHHHHFFWFVFYLLSRFIIICNIRQKICSSS